MVILLALVALLAFATPSPAAAPERERCLPEQPAPRCQVWTARVTKVSDGDTITAQVHGDGTRETRRIRLTGIQAMELTRYATRSGRAGECHAVDATERLERLIAAARNRVRLAAIHPTAMSGDRIRRHVAVRHRGEWVDVAVKLLDEGLALWLASDTEWAWNGHYSRLAELAAVRRVGIWDGRSCGPPGAPAADAQLRLKVKWNADGNDARHLNGEWVRITNPHPLRPVSLAGWWLRDSNLRRFVLPVGAAVPAGGSIRVRVGSGANDARTFHWGLDVPIFDNAMGNHMQMGDGAYLFDPSGNLRAHVQYPCRRTCTEPLRRKVAITAHRRAPEYIRVRNTSNAQISLSEYEIESAQWFYEFGRDAVLLPGQALDLYVQRAPGLGSITARSWGWPERRLREGRGAVTLRNPRGAPVACDAWGGRRCPKV